MADGDRSCVRGQCRCGRIVYESQLSKTQLAFKCNCSLCVKKGYLWVFPGQNNFDFIRGNESMLTTYKFGPRKLNHKFCPVCGTSVMASTKGDDPEFDLALNAEAIPSFDTSKLSLTQYDGASIGDPYEYPAFDGVLPAKVFRSDTIYTGSCHCGSLTLATNVRLDRLASDTTRCDCQVCQTPSCIWVHPRPGQTVLNGNAATAERYSNDSHVLIFCKNCGVTVAIDTSQNTGSSTQEYDHEGVSDSKTIYAVNALVLHGIDSALKKELKI